MEPVTVIGAGLAGSECAVQLARRGIPVRLCEMKPLRRSPAHRTDGPAELVCSNSLRSDSPDTPIGLLHAELRRLGSVILGEADLARVPAGEALAVDRERFSAGVERALASAPGLERAVGEVESLPPGDGRRGHRAADLGGAHPGAVRVDRRQAVLLRLDRAHRRGGLGGRGASPSGRAAGAGATGRTT